MFLNFLIKPFWIFGIEREVQNVVGAENYGFYFSLFNFSYLLNIILDFGITNYNNRTIAQSPSLLSKYVSNIVVLRFVLGFIYAFLAILLGFILKYSSEQMFFLLILVFNQFLASFVLYLRSNISGLQYYKTDSAISVLDRFLMILFCAILLWTPITGKKFQIEWFAFCQTAAYLITAIVAFLVVLTKVKYFRFKINYKFFLVILRKSYPYAILTLLMAFYNRVDGVMLERLIENGKEQAGIYAQAFRLNDAASMFAYLFAVLLLPMFANMLKRNENIAELSKLAFLLIFIPSLLLSLFCLFYNSEIMSLLYNENFDESSSILPFLMIGFLGIATTYIFGTLLTANGNMKQLNIMAACGMVLNISLNLILIPIFQAKGAAISSMITQLATAVAQLIIAKFIFNLSVNYKLIIKLFVFLLIVVTLFYFSVNIEYIWYFKVLILFVIAFVLAFLLRLFSVKEILQSLKTLIVNRK